MRTRTSPDLAVAVAAACLCSVACGGGSPPRDAESGPTKLAITDVERFMPLEDDTVYAFETLTENTGEKGVLMMQVARPRANQAVLTVGGKAQRLDIDAQGVRLANGGWLLKGPLSAGATFKGQFGQVVVRSVDAQVQVPAGRFTGCVETVEESPAVKKRVLTVFCPKVGIVLLDAEGAIGDDFGREQAALRSYGKRVDVNALPPSK
jgi:hypothetical protein